MSAFRELDECLGFALLRSDWRDAPDPYWEDAGSELAREILERLGPSDWRELQVSWRTRSDQWQWRIARTLGGSGERQKTIAVLVQSMPQAPDDEVVDTAAESLGGLEFTAVDLEADADVVETLRAIARNPSAPLLKWLSAARVVTRSPNTWAWMRRPYAGSGSCGRRAARSARSSVRLPRRSRERIRGRYGAGPSASSSHVS